MGKAFHAKRGRMRKIAIFASLICVLMLSSEAQSLDLQVEIIEVPGPYRTEVSGINNSGVAIGTFYNPQRGFLRDAGNNFTTLAVMGTDTEAFGLNDLGDIIGVFYDLSGSYGYKLDSVGNLTIIDVPGASATHPRDINNSGTVVGFFESPTGVHGFLRDTGGNYTILDPPGATWGGFTGTFATGINDAGQIVGNFQDINGVHGFLRDAAGNYITLDVPGENVTGASGINNRGEIVGFLFNQAGGVPSGVHGFLRDTAGSYTILDAPGVPETRLLDINDGGKIVGQYTDASGQGYSFITEYQVVVQPIEVNIEIRPWSDINWIVVRRHGLLHVAILSTDDFDALGQVDQKSLTFGATGDEHSLAFCIRWGTDINHDGLKDLVCVFYSHHTGFQCGDTQGILKGVTKEGKPIQGSDSVRIIPCEK